MPQASLPPSEYYSIVVLGAMNPPIHNPTWYRIIGLSTEADEKHALGASDVIVVPQFSHFTTPEFSITCSAERWDVSTLKEQFRGRILDVAIKVFEKLFETPVRAFGYNTNLHTIVGCSSVTTELARIGAATGLPLPAQESSECTFMFTKRDGLKTTMYAVAPSSLGEQLVATTFNSHFDLKPTPEYRDLTPLLKEQFESHWAEAKKFSDSVANRLSDATRR